MNFSTLNSECNNEETLQEEFQALKLSTRKQENLLFFCLHGREHLQLAWYPGSSELVLLAM